MVPDRAQAERQHLPGNQTKDNYGNIWEGECRSSVAGAIYSKEIAEALQAQRIVPGSYGSETESARYGTWGFNDSMSII